MKLWLISQDQNQAYDTFDSAVVAAPDEAAARSISPRGDIWAESPDEKDHYFNAWKRGNAENKEFLDWARSPASVTARLIGDAAPGIKMGVVCASFNAG
jgi:hypothetical protein